MNDYIEVIAIVEGRTEELFINSLLQPYLAEKRIYIQAMQVSKSGQKGGDIRFSRVVNDIAHHLKQRSDTYVTTFIDYYGTKEWPGLSSIPIGASSKEIIHMIDKATKQALKKALPHCRIDTRFILFMAIHEFEALLFSDSSIIANELGVPIDRVDAILAECGSPESINNSPNTAPSKRLNQWSYNGKFPKTTTGIDIAHQIGIDKMRSQCPTFHDWLTTFETLVQTP